MQKGYKDKKKTDFKTTNSILVSNLPLLAKKNTYFKKSLNMKTIFYEDVYRCNSRSEAFELLSGTEAEKAMTEHIESKFGSVAEFETFSYDIESILNRLGFTKTMGMAADETMIHEGDNYDQKIDSLLGDKQKGQTNKTGEKLDDEVELLKEEISFDQMLVDSSDVQQKLEKDNEKTKFDTQADEAINLLDQTRVAQVQQENKEKDKVSLKLDQPIKKTGFLKFDSYESKLKMMDTSLFLFGLKLHRQVGVVSFVDADFANTISITSKVFEDKTLAECCQIVNHGLIDAGYFGDPMEVPTLKGINDFDL